MGRIHSCPFFFCRRGKFLCDKLLTMATTLLHVRRAFTPTVEIPDAGILFRDGVIEAVAPRSSMTVPAGAEEIEALEESAAPGFLDVHIHGAGGHDVMEGTTEALTAVSKTVAAHGTTSFVATTMTADASSICQSAEGISKYMGEQRLPGDSRAEVLGIHFEGPFVNPIRRGAQQAEFIKLPSAELLAKFVEAAGGHAQILTMAPELLGAMPCIDAARKSGLVVGIGHTDATYEQARAAISRGAHHAVHVYNAMRPFTHRDSGVIGAVLTTPEVTAELIADGVHVDETAMRLLLQAKGAGGVILISDGISATGMPDGKYLLGSLDVTVSGGICRDAEGRLAGSTLTLDRALRNIVGLGASVADALRMLTLNPATLLGIEFKKGSLRTGADADIVLLDERLNLTRVWTQGISQQAA
jgi:N-acetylglucosamine-6-phosphate deacetylase